MLTPSERNWSRRQKWLIIGVVALALIVGGALVSSYERYHRLPSDDVLLGTWQMTMPYGMDSTAWMTFPPKHAVILSSFSVAGYQIDSEGVWYAGGKYIYMGGETKPPVIWEIVEIRPNELRLRSAKQDYIFKRDDQNALPSI
jgi:hypothetical protein